jgi:hypothetical protein
LPADAAHLPALVLVDTLSKDNEDTISTYTLPEMSRHKLVKWVNGTNAVQKLHEFEAKHLERKQTYLLQLGGKPSNSAKNTNATEATAANNSNKDNATADLAVEDDVVKQSNQKKRGLLKGHSAKKPTEAYADYGNMLMRLHDFLEHADKYMHDADPVRASGPVLLMSAFFGRCVI